MGLFTGLSQFVENVSASYDALLKRSLSSFLEVETRDTGNQFDLVCHDGTLLSVFKVDGCFDVIGPEEVENLVLDVAEGLSVALKSPAHKIQFFFSRDPDATADMLGKAMAGAETAARQQDLDLAVLLRERKNHLLRYICAEDCYVALWTSQTILNPLERKDLTARLQEHNKEAPPARDGQWPYLTVDAARSRHNAVSESFVSVLRKAGISANRLEAHDALIAMFGTVSPGRSGWRPYLPGDRVRRVVLDRLLSEDDVSFIMGPPLSRQMFPHDAERIDRRTVKIGPVLWTSCDMTMGPEIVRPFADLLNDMIRADHTMPWRVSFMLEGGGLHGFGLKKNIASILTWIGPLGGMVNRQIRDSITALSDYVEEGGSVVRLRVSFSTWARDSADGREVLRQRAETLAQTITQWGGCQVDSMVGDTLEGVMSSALAINRETTAPRSAAPLTDSLTLLPLARPASPWQEGGLLLRTRDGKFFPYQPGSRLQTTWVDIVFSPPGGGKSVLLNSINLASILSPQDQTNALLPLISVLDVGPSARGLVELIRAVLPEHRKNEAVYVKLRNSAQYAVNPFDTQLGMDVPLPHERAFLINLVTMMVTPPGYDAPYDAMTDLVSRLIDIAYEKHGAGENGRPSLYARLMAPEVDEALERLALLKDLPASPTWWEVRDALFDRNQWQLASVAQRFAVPTLLSLIEASQDQRIQDEFSRLENPVTVSSTGERLIDAFNRIMRSAQDRFKMMSRPTSFDRGAARLFVLDLNEVAQTGSAEADQMTTLMYMVGRHLAGRDFFLDPDDMPDLFPERYRDWQRARMVGLKRTSRRLVYDELHRATKSGSAIITRQLADDVRVGRKSGLQIVLASQMLGDFPEAIIENSTGIWIMKAGQDSSQEQIARAFGLSGTQRNLLARLHGADKDGASMLCVFSTKTGRYRQHLVSTIGPIEMWAFSSTAEDMAIRSALFSKLGVSQALTVLARRFPGGSAIPEIERRKTLIRAEGGEAAASVIEGLIDDLAKDGVKGA